MNWKYKEGYEFLWSKCVEPIWDGLEQYEKDEIDTELNRIFGVNRRC